MKKVVIKSTNWLTAGLSEEEILAKKTLATIAADIQLKRIELGLNQKEFAKLLGVSQRTISRWESGTYDFTITTLINLCKKLGLSFKPQIISKEEEELINQLQDENKKLKENNEKLLKLLDEKSRKDLDEVVSNTNTSKCWKCVNEVKCKASGIYKSNCRDYKRDAPDGGYYG